MFDYRAKLSDKIRKRGDDGDTVLLVWDQGRDTHGEEAVRLSGVWAPELGEPGYQDAADYLHGLLASATQSALKGGRRWPFHLFTEPNTATEPSERESFTRFIGELYILRVGFQSPGWIPDPDYSINRMMISFLASHPEWGKGQQ
jgi:hypothetical protein